MRNSIFAIKPYKWEGLWVFDDPAVGLVREPFVGGADTMIDVATVHLPNAEHGFLALFSASPPLVRRSFWIGFVRMAEETSIAGLKRAWRAGSARRCSSISRNHRRSCTSK
jgi:hypothetical protein